MSESPSRTALYEDLLRRVASGVHHRGPRHHDDPLSRRPHALHLARGAADRDPLVDLGGDVVGHEAEDRVVAAALGRTDADAGTAQGHRLALLHLPLLDARGCPAAQDDGAVHLLIDRGDPGAGHAHQGVEVGSGVELVGQDAVRLRGRESRVPHFGGGGAEVGQPLHDAVEDVGIRGLDRHPGRGGLGVGAPHPELQDLEGAALLHHAVEHLLEDVRVDQMPFEKDGLLDHARALAASGLAAPGIFPSCPRRRSRRSRRSRKTGPARSLPPRRSSRAAAWCWRSRA